MYIIRLGLGQAWGLVLDFSRHTLAWALDTWKHGIVRIESLLYLYLLLEARTWALAGVFFVLGWRWCCELRVG